MFIFPLIYISTFLFTIREFIKGNKQALLLFLIFGLSIYITALSVTFKMGFKESIPYMQSFKEIIIVGVLGWSIYRLKTNIKLHFIDQVILAYFAYTLIYTILPIGEQHFFTRLFAFKTSSFFVLVYFTGRLFDPAKVFVNKYFLYLLILAIVAALVVLFEVFTNQHLQSLSGYADFNYYFFNFEPSGNYGLSWTFESEGGFKRFASFFANPLEHAAATLISLSVLAAFYTNDKYELKLDWFGLIAFAATLISITFAVSRSSFVSYFILIYAYGWLTNRKYITKIAHIGLAIFAMYIFLQISQGNNDSSGVQKIIMNTLDFSNPSSIGHVFEWVQGINAIIEHPLGLGLGSSGRVAGSLGENIGGENQFIIIGVQLGIVALTIYIALYTAIIRAAIHWYYKLKGKEKKVCLLILLIKIGLLIPLLTSEIESSIYISYMSWFITGLFVHIISTQTKSANNVI